MTMPRIPQRRRRAQEAGGAGRARSTAEVTQIQQAARALPGLRAALGLPERGDEDALLLQIDPANLPIAEPILAALSDEMARAAGVSKERLLAQIDKRGSLVSLHRESEALTTRVRGGRLVMAAAQAELWRRLVTGITEELGGLPPGERATLRADAGEVLALDEEARAQVQAKGRKTRQQKKRAEQALTEAEKRRRLLQTLFAIQGGQEVSPEALDEATAVYQELEDRRVAAR